MKTVRQELNDYIDALAFEIHTNNLDATDSADLHDAMHEYVDGSEYVIYYGKAWELVSVMRLTDYSTYEAATMEEELEMANFKSLDSYICYVAYNIVYHELSLAIQELIDKRMAA